MSQIEGQPVVDEQTVAPPVVDDVPEDMQDEFATEDERMFAEEFERRAAIERGDEPEDVPAVVDPDGEPAPDAMPMDVSPDSSAAGTPEGTAPEQTPEQTPADEKPAWYHELSEEAKLEFDRKDESINQLQWQYTAVHGRLAPVQAQVDRLTRQLSERQPARPASPGEQTTPTASTPVTDFESEEFLKFAEEYPDEAKAMKTLFAQQQTHVQRLEEQVGTLSQGFEQIQSTSNAQQIQQELNALTEAHPDWMQVRNSPQFDTWLQTQPPSVQPMVNSKLASDCSYLLDRYKQDVYFYQLEQGGGVTPPAPTADQVVAENTRQHRSTLINTPTPNPQGGGVGVPGVTGTPQTDEEMWIEEIERRLRAQKNQR